MSLSLQANGIHELRLDALQKDIKDARFWDSEIQKEGLVWTRLWQHAYKAGKLGETCNARRVFEVYPP